MRNLRKRGENEHDSAAQPFENEQLALQRSYQFKVHQTNSYFSQPESKTAQCSCFRHSGLLLVAVLWCGRVPSLVDQTIHALVHLLAPTMPVHQVVVVLFARVLGVDDVPKLQKLTTTNTHSALRTQLRLPLRTQFRHRCSCPPRELYPNNHEMKPSQQTSR